jgi:DNA-binding transcriptional LysR family regulator
MGVIRHAEELLVDDLTSSRLVRVLPGWRSERPLHILYAPDRRITPKLRSFLDFAAARFGTVQNRA